ncbi:CapA family protein [Roseomonas populi]|uniref:CapA family protein n=1 Tax=Roseomonas populi TaxID=3121582 RepID=A0ABT1XAV5_9PROT|nr:CapA family protein [Roseomonas pecuniae]MCR0985240.1 CapA family protein [Roseomonas pecuniae]
MPLPLRLALTGDSILQRRLLSRTDPVLRPLFDMIRGADVAFTNFETLANDFRGDPALESGGSHFGAPAWVLDELAEGGFSLFATATNHALDYGVSGLLHTLEALDARGLSHAGLGRNLEEARRPVFHGHPNGTVAMLACSATFAKGQEASAQRPDMPGRPGLNPLRYDTVHEVRPEHMRALREMADGLGLEAFRQMIVKLGFGFPPEEGVFPFGPLNFREAEKVAQRQTAKAADMDGIARWVREARLTSDVVLVSFHAHEHDFAATKEQPAEFLPVFARRMIDEGADLVVGHGPHLLRGMEVYKGRPIFYSLGNFIGQNELVPRLPSDSYERFRADPSLTPGMVYSQRTRNDEGGFPSDGRYWETVVPFLTFEEGRMTGLEIVPVSLGLGEARHLRGRPRLAEGAQARSILGRFAALSEPFGTRLRLEGERAFLDLAPAAAPIRQEEPA